LPGIVLDLVTLGLHLERFRERGARIVLTNGVFDLLHVGHLRYLRQAHALGDVLVVGVNADAAVVKPGRPLMAEAEAAELVGALEPGEFVVIFPTPPRGSAPRGGGPDVLPKGRGHREASLPEAATARELGVELVFIPLVEGHSTSELLRNLSS